MTLVVGTFAYGIYRKQKRDTKQRAAEIILLEIEDAEQQLAKVSVDKPFPDLRDEQIKLMPMASWSQNKHLFMKDFDRNEIDKISDFYIRCADYDSASMQNSINSFEMSTQELRVNAQRILADYAREFNDSLEAAKDDDERQDLEQAYIKRRRQFIEIYGNTSETHMYTYVPAKPFNDAIRALQGLEQSLSLTSVGVKLKMIARPRGRLRRFWDFVLGKP